MACTVRLCPRGLGLGLLSYFASLARTREAARGPSLPRSRKARFGSPNRRACSQATKGDLCRFQVYERAVILLIKGYERIGKSDTRHYLKRVLITYFKRRIYGSEIIRLRVLAILFDIRKVGQ